MPNNDFATRLESLMEMAKYGTFRQRNLADLGQFVLDRAPAIAQVVRAAQEVAKHEFHGAVIGQLAKALAALNEEDGKCGLSVTLQNPGWRR